MMRTNIWLYRIVLLFTLLTLLSSCISTVTYLAPQEISMVGLEQEVKLLLRDGSKITLFDISIVAGMVTGQDEFGGIIQLDIGHAYMSTGTDGGFFAYIRELGGSIVEIHHNCVNHYGGRYMEHQPLNMNNMIDFQGTYTMLKEIGNSGPIVCEIQGQDIAQVISHCHESKRMIVGIWEGSRNLSQRWNVPELQP
jgi:hypothetical protein